MWSEHIPIELLGSIDRNLPFTRPISSSDFHGHFPPQKCLKIRKNRLDLESFFDAYVLFFIPVSFPANYGNSRRVIIVIIQNFRSIIRYRISGWIGDFTWSSKEGCFACRQGARVVLRGNRAPREVIRKEQLETIKNPARTSLWECHRIYTQRIWLMEDRLFCRCTKTTSEKEVIMLIYSNKLSYQHYLEDALRTKI